MRKESSAPDGPGWSLRVVANKFPALKIEGEMSRVGEGLYDKMNGIGAHEVIIESPRHDADLETLPARAIEDCLWVFKQRIDDLKNDPRFRYILIFKNHGEAAGATLEHTHCQLIALPIVPQLVHDEIMGSRRHYEYKERCIFCDMISQEISDGRRVVGMNERFIALCPYAPRFPFETWILPRFHSARFESGERGQYESLAALLKETLLKMRSSLGAPSYNFVLHTAPINEDHDAYFHWHIEIMPKLTKMAGFEQGTGFYINPVLPEEAAENLRKATA